MVDEDYYGASTYKTEKIEPDSSFNANMYIGYTTPESKGLFVEVTGNEEYVAEDYFTSAKFYLLNNNNYAIKNVVVSELKSYAFKESYYDVAASNLGSLKPGDEVYVSIILSTANIPAGNYPMIFLISFLNYNNTKEIVAYTNLISRKVLKKAAPT